MGSLFTLMSRSRLSVRWPSPEPFEKRNGRRGRSLPRCRIASPRTARSWGSSVVKGTLVQVEMVLAHLARTLDVDEVLSFYPKLTPDDVRACLDFARTQVADAPREENAAVAATG
jgi:uncharacterized protein (DUF433 family)